MGAGRSVLNGLWKACSWEAWKIICRKITVPDLPIQKRNEYFIAGAISVPHKRFDVLNLFPQLLPVSPYPSHLCISLVSNPRNLIGLHAIPAVGVYDPRTPWWPNVAMDLRAVTAPNTNRQIWGSLWKEEFLMDAYWGVKNLRSLKKCWWIFFALLASTCYLCIPGTSKSHWKHPEELCRHQSRCRDAQDNL